MSSGIGAAAEVLVNLYLNDHRPKTQATSPDLVRKCTVSLHLKIFVQPHQTREWEDPKEPLSPGTRGAESRPDPAEAEGSYISSKTDFTWVLVVHFPAKTCSLLSVAFRIYLVSGLQGCWTSPPPSAFSVQPK